jgi:hypothetical protein
MNGHKPVLVPRCPAHPEQLMQPHYRDWAWLCPVELALGQPSPQPHRMVNGKPKPVPLPRAGPP